MTLCFSHCVFIGGDENRIEKPGTVTITNATFTVDDFVFRTDEDFAGSAMGMIASWAADRINSATQ